MNNIFFNEDVLPAEKSIINSLNIPPIILMENAGSNSAKKILSEYRELLKSETVILCGKGNNGGDGFVIARHLLNEGLKVKIILLYPEEEISNEALINFRILLKLDSRNLKIVSCQDSNCLSEEIYPEKGLLIDAVFGVGFKGKLDLRIETAFKFINSLKNKTVISVDVPSGLYDFNQHSICIKADTTFSMCIKKFQTLFYNGKANSGDVSLIDIGISGDEFTKLNNKRIFQQDASDIKNFLPLRKADSNKYTNGKVLILSGSPGLTGAAYLCSQAALKTGSGAVIIAIPKSIAQVMERKLTEVMKFALEETAESTISIKSYKKIKPKLKWADAVLIGPGLSKNKETLELVRKIVKENNSYFVIDADAISAFKNNLNLLKNKKIILTPHAGEFANLTGESAESVKNKFFELAQKFAARYGIVLVLKNAPTVITDGERFFVNSTGRENLATAGTGDVLAGIIASLLSRTKNLLGSSLAGTYIHGKCGDNLFDKSGSDSTIAGDLLKEISIVKNQILNS